MYKMNVLIKFVFVILILSIVVIANNRIILWLILLLLSIYNLRKYKKVLLIIDLILVLLLGLSKDNEMYLMIFKLIFIINFMLTVYSTLTINNKSLFVRRKTNKLDYFENNFERVVNNLNERKKEVYDEDVSIDDRIENELERQYLQSRIRYYNYSSNKKWYNLNRIDVLVLLLIIVVFIILFILR